MTERRFDPNLIALLASGSVPATSAPASQTDLFAEALTRVVDWVAGGDKRSGRVNVTSGSDFAWILVDQWTPEGSNELHFTARTNDLDLFAACPPSFHVADPNPGVVHEQAAAFLAGKFAGKDVEVKVFRSEGSRSEPVERASTDRPEFREVPELPSL